MNLLSRRFYAVLTLLLTLSGCAGNAHKESTGDYIDDSVITTKVKSALLAEKGLESTSITVKTFKGNVQLSGFVASKDQAHKANRVAYSVKGVRQVSNNLLIK